MEINLDKNDVMRILAKHFDLILIDLHPTVKGCLVELKNDDIYWEGNPKPEE